MDMLLILDFGGPQAQAVARRLRGESVYCEILPFDADVEAALEKKPRGIVLAGGEDGAERDCADGFYAAGLPMLCLGYTARAALRRFGGTLAGTALERRIAHIEFGDDPLFASLSECDRFFERADGLALPEGFELIARGGADAAYACAEKRIWGLQFYPEPNDPDGLRILSNFADICGCAREWTIENFIDQSIDRIREQVGEGDAFIAISGGVDSTVCAVLMHRAIGRRMHCVHVDTGLMRKNEAEQIEKMFGDMGMDLRLVHAKERFLKSLRGAFETGEKRRIVGEEFGRALEEEAGSMGERDHLVQGTIYTDVLGADDVSGGFTMAGRRFAGLVEPLRMLFKDEVRRLGVALGLPEEMVYRQPFPGPGLAVRCMGEVTEEKLEILREADAIFREEIQAAGLDKRIRQYFAVLTDGQTGHIVALRAVNTIDAARSSAVRLPYDLLERCVERIMGEVKGVERVVYDISGSPAGVEWE